MALTMDPMVGGSRRPVLPELQRLVGKLPSSGVEHVLALVRSGEIAVPPLLQSLLEQRQILDEIVATVRTNTGTSSAFTACPSCATLQP